MRPRKVIGPMVLIGLGTIFLLNNLGLLDWSIWSSLWRLWPILLIAAGLDMVFGRKTPWASWVIAGLMVITVGGVVLYGGIGDFGGAVFDGDVISQSLSGAISADVQIKSGVARLTLAESTTPCSLRSHNSQHPDWRCGPD